jgi:hypothetical protein
MKKMRKHPTDLVSVGPDLTLLRMVVGHIGDYSTMAIVPSQAAMSLMPDVVSSRPKDVRNAGNDGESHNLMRRPYGHKSAPRAGFNLPPTTIWLSLIIFIFSFYSFCNSHV